MYFHLFWLVLNMFLFKGTELVTGSFPLTVELSVNICAVSQYYIRCFIESE